MDDKQRIRKEFLKKRLEFIPFKKPLDQKIFQKFINLLIVKKAKTIRFYVSKEDEVDTHELIKYFLGETVCNRVAPFRVQPSKAKRVVVPRVVGKNLELYGIKKWSDLAPGAFGILEPIVLSPKFLVLSSHVALRTAPGHLGGGAKRLLKGERLKQVDKNEIDLFVVPGLVFSKSGQRLGFGKGYYDRLLKNTKGFKLGLAYSWQIVEKLPEEKEDVLMDAVSTEKSKLLK